MQARAAWAVVSASVLLRRKPTDAVVRRLVSRRAVRQRVAPDEAMRAVRRGARVFGGACLPQSVALTALLARQGDTPTLVLGCRLYENHEWGAHAWVQLGASELDPVPSGPHASLAHLNAATDWKPVAAAPQPDVRR